MGEPFPDPDSIMKALMERTGYRPVVYRGDTLQFSTKNKSLHIRQRAKIDRAGERLEADSVVYDSTKFIIGYGQAKLVNASGEEVTSEEGPLYYHTERKLGTVIGARTQWEIWNVEGNFTLEGSDTLWVESGFFTSCELPEPHYRFESDKMKLIFNNIVVAWPVRVYFGNVPVFWFPFIAQDIRSGRHSGLLSLRFGVNDIVRNQSGYNRHISNVGYFWAMNDYMDLQASMDWWSGTWTRFDGFYQYRWVNRFLDGRIGYSRFWLPDGGSEVSATWDHRQRFGERTDLRASVRFVSSQEFQREAEFNPERLTQTIRSNVGLTRRFNWGNLNLSGQRVQPIAGGEATTTTLPQFSITLTPLVLTRARSPLDARWYHGLTWTGSTNLTRTLVETPSIITLNTDSITADTTFIPNRSVTNLGLTSNLTLGNLRWNSSGTYAEQVTDAPDTVTVEPVDSLSGPITVFLGDQIIQGTLNWRTSFGYQQRLVGSTTLTPALSLDGSFFRSNDTGLDFLAAPTRLSASATLNADVYGFFPGFGPLERIRHKFAPSFSWIYSPAVEVGPEFEGIRGFNPAAAGERHQLSVTFTQTFEAKRKPRKKLEEEAATDTTESRGPAESQKLTLLAIRTSTLAYDFVEKELITEQVSNSVTSDLLRGLTLRLDHDLFEERANGRIFKPYLTQVNLSFSLGERTLAGLFGAPSTGVGRQPGIVPEGENLEDLEVERRVFEEEDPRGDSGMRRPWSLSLDYSLLKQRPVLGQEPRPVRQSIRANFGFSPTDNWTLTWRTQYDIEEGTFVDQVLTLRRDLHRWSATFGFLKASNGNFVFNFQVNLNDLRDVKFDYRQESF
jgi:hypothetical protein